MMVLLDFCVCINECRHNAKETQMSTINFNANEVEPSTGYDPIPVGKYQAVITESEMKPTKTGNGQYLQLEFEIIEGDYKNRKIWARLNLENANTDAVRIARADLSAICLPAAAGLPGHWMCS